MQKKPGIRLAIWNHIKALTKNNKGLCHATLASRVLWHHGKSNSEIYRVKAVSNMKIFE